MKPPRIVADSARQVGRPCVAGTRIPAETLAERFAAGESVDSLVRDYRTARLGRAAVELALRFELWRRVGQRSRASVEATPETGVLVWTGQRMPPGASA